MGRMQFGKEKGGGPRTSNRNQGQATVTRHPSTAAGSRGTCTHKVLRAAPELAAQHKETPADSYGESKPSYNK